MPKQALTAALEIIINKALSLDPDSQANLEAINGRSLTVNLREFDFPLTFIAEQKSMLVVANNTSEDCVLTTSLSTLGKLRQSSLITSLIKSGELDIEGDPKIAQQFARLGEQLSIDWEQQLAHRIGDVGAYKVHQLALSIGKKLQFAKQQISQDASEFLLHEQPMLVASHQQHDFTLAVTLLEQQTQELDARLTNLIEQADQISR